MLVYARVPVANEVTLVTRELLANAVEHGNRMDPHKKAYYTLEELCGAGFYVTVKDEGRGFDFVHMDPPHSPAGYHSGKRGYLIIRNCSRRIIFRDNGSTVSVFVGLGQENGDVSTSLEAMEAEDALPVSGLV